MAYFEIFFVKRLGKDGKPHYQPKTIDSFEVESWEKIDDDHTGVTMCSGDAFILQIDYETFSEIIISEEDAYGKILTFSKN